MQLTPEQLLNLPMGTPARHIESGDTVYRYPLGIDDTVSVYFTANPGEDYDGSFYETAELEVDYTFHQSIARPVLEERKLGKISIELFDEGFPNAVLAIGEVMTWAAEHKGYKPHDWKNLPEARTAFLAAASRHRVKRHIQHVTGVPVEAQTDEESNLLHLAHEAFNVLAQLELAITNRLN